MPSRLPRRFAQRAAALIILMGVPVATAQAEVFRSSVVVEKRPGLARRLAELEVDGLAREALMEQFIATRMSASLVTLRGDQIRTALAPVETLLDKFTVVTRDDVDASHVRVICEAEVDAAALVLRLVNGRVLTFGQAAPRVLLTSAPGTRTDVMQALRGRLGDTLGSAGITLLAAEMTVAEGPRSGRWFNPDAVQKAAIASRADFVAVVGFTAAPAPSLVGGAVLDGTIQYTLMRPHDAAIVAEQVFTERGSGTSQALATQMIMDVLAPQLAKGLGGRLAEAIFANGSVIDPDVPAGKLTLNVFYRPSPAATSALMALLREKGFATSLGSGHLGPTLAPIAMPADQVIVESPATVERLYDILANIGFGTNGVLRASVFEYGDDYIGLEILDRTKPALAPVKKKPMALPAVNGSDSVGVAAAVGRTGAPAVPAGTPASASAGSAGTPASTSSGSTGARTGVQASSASKPLEFRLSAAFAAAASPRH